MTFLHEPHMPNGQALIEGQALAEGWNHLTSVLESANEALIKVAPHDHAPGTCCDVVEAILVKITVEGAILEARLEALLRSVRGNQ